jgi:hypothetical protein
MSWFAVASLVESGDGFIVVPNANAHPSNKRSRPHQHGHFFHQAQRTNQLVTTDGYGSLQRMLQYQKTKRQKMKVWTNRDLNTGPSASSRMQSGRAKPLRHTPNLMMSRMHAGLMLRSPAAGREVWGDRGLGGRQADQLLAWRCSRYFNFTGDDVSCQFLQS